MGVNRVSNKEYPIPHWNEWADRIVTRYNMKRTGKDHYNGPCPCCVGTDRFYISNKNNRILFNCNQGCDAIDLITVMQEDNVWPLKQSNDWPTVYSDNAPFKDTTPQPYNVRKGVQLHNAKIQGNDLFVPIMDMSGERIGYQKITPEGEKRFNQGLDKEGAFSIIGGPLDGLCYLAEGWATSASVHEGTGRPTVFCLDAGNLPKVAEQLIQQNPDCTFVVAADHDEKGIKAAEETGLPYFTPERIGLDWNDVHLARGKEYLTKKLKPRDPMDDIVMIADAQPVLKANYLVKNWIGVEQFAVLYGPSNVGKSFFMLDMAFHIAAGKEWHGNKVRGGAVLYLATEGGVAFRNRAWAIKNKYEADDVPLAIRPMPVNLLDPDADMPELMRLVDAIKDKYGDLKMIVVDTLSRAMAGGNENGPEDMTAFIGNCDVLKDHAKCSIAVVHHSGKDTAAGARGHSSLRAASDTEIELGLDATVRVAKATKQRDMETGKEFGFNLDVVELGLDEDGDKVTTCTIKPVTDEELQEAKQKPLDGKYKLLMDCFWQLKGEGVGNENPSGAGWPDSGTYWVMDVEKLKEHFRGKADYENANTFRSAWKRVTEKLLQRGFLYMNENQVAALKNEDKY